MAGTRLWTQATYVLGVLLLAPFAVLRLLSPRKQPLCRARHLAEQVESVLHGSVNSTRRLGFMLRVILPSTMAEVIQASRSGWYALNDDVELELEEGASIALDEKVSRGDRLRRLCLRRNRGSHAHQGRVYSLFLLDSSEVSEPSVEWDRHLRCGVVMVPQGRMTTSELIEPIAKARQCLLRSLWPADAPDSTQIPPPWLPVRMVLLSEGPSHECRWDFSILQSALDDELHRLADARIVALDLYAQSAFLSDEVLAQLADRPRTSRVLTRSALGMVPQVMEQALPGWWAAEGHDVQPFHVLCLCGGGGAEDGWRFVGERGGEGGHGSAASTVAVVGAWGGVVAVDALQDCTQVEGRRHIYDLPFEACRQLTQSVLRVIRVGVLRHHDDADLSQSPRLSEVELDRLQARTVRGRVAEASTLLRALQDLSDSSAGVPIGPRVSKMAFDAARALEAFVHAVEAGRWEDAVDLAERAWTSAKAAHSHESVMAPPSFPLQHYVAVVVPLVLPLAVPLIVGSLKEWQRYREKAKKLKGD